MSAGLFSFVVVFVPLVKLVSGDGFMNIRDGLHRSRLDGNMRLWTYGRGRPVQYRRLSKHAQYAG